AGQPGEEVCNGLDDDCDGEVDDGFAGLGTPCTVGLGACRRVGIVQCMPDGQDTSCSALPGPAGPEVCNGLDDDCDGHTDEGAAWAEQGQPCSAGLGSCTRAGIWACDEADPAGPLRCTARPAAPGPELCDGLDNDCNGTVDDDLADPQLCENQDGVCRGARKTCGGVRGYLPCSSANYPAEYESNETRCDRLDNDCDGRLDEELVGPPCPLTRGVCAGTRTSCAGGRWSECVAATYGPLYQAVEVRCDLLDNDCDGQVDEGWLVDGQYARHDACGNCFTDCTAIYARPNAHGVCSAAAGPVCVMQCCRPGDHDARCDGGQGLQAYFDLNAVPDDGCELLLDPQAIYVSRADPQADDLAGCGRGPVATGAGNRPCRTIGAGLSEARTAGRPRLLVADGLYEETVTSSNGVSLLGGYRADTWERHLSSTMTIVRGNEDALHQRTLVAPGITSPTVVQGFIIYGPANSRVTGNSYAIYVSSSDSDLQLLDNVIYGGSGGPGLNPAAAAAGQNGVNGAGRTANPAGYDAKITDDPTPCDASDNRQLDNGGKRSCGADSIDGGQGGGNRCPPGFQIEQSGLDGSAGQAGDGANGGAGGAGGDAGDDGVMMASDCYLPPSTMVGRDGANGQPGRDGSGGTRCSGGEGSVVAGHWVA
ncbi:MAG: hypothetical protein FJ125_14045, partial [Deltaproteobacteria bacterium]|nr:hypothetical protein [Deltaproteobacteria bacterium]